jgi:putative transposase
MTERMMPQSLSLVIVHLIFSTKDRAALIPPEMGPRLHAYLAEVARGLGCHAWAVWPIMCIWPLRCPAP